MSHWDIISCSTPPIDGALLAPLYPGRIFTGDYAYVFTNYFKQRPLRRPALDRTSGPVVAVGHPGIPFLQ